MEIIWKTPKCLPADGVSDTQSVMLHGTVAPALALRLCVLMYEFSVTIITLVFRSTV